MVTRKFRPLQKYCDEVCEIVHREKATNGALILKKRGREFLIWNDDPRIMTRRAAKHHGAYPIAILTVHEELGGTRLRARAVEEFADVLGVDGFLDTLLDTMLHELTTVPSELH
jgi:hypothetical protein